MAVSWEQAAQSKAMPGRPTTTSTSSDRRLVLSSAAAGAKGLVLCILVGILLALVHLLLELLCFLFVCK